MRLIKQISQENSSSHSWSLSRSKLRALNTPRHLNCCFRRLCWSKLAARGRVREVSLSLASVSVSLRLLRLRSNPSFSLCRWDIAGSSDTLSRFFNSAASILTSQSLWWNFSSGIASSISSSSNSPLGESLDVVDSSESSIFTTTLSFMMFPVKLETTMLLLLRGDVGRWCAESKLSGSLLSSHDRLLSWRDANFFFAFCLLSSTSRSDGGEDAKKIVSWESPR